MQRSENIGKLADALAKAQGQIKGALKDSANPFFKSKYADLAAVWEACREALSSNGLAVVQLVRSNEAGVEVETVLACGNETIGDVLAMPVAKADAQGVGSAITYARRYALAAIVGVAPEDDDGNAAAAASNRQNNQQATKPTPSSQGKEQTLAMLKAAAKLGLVQLEAAWKGLDKPDRLACLAEMPALKEEAQSATPPA